MLVCVVGYAIGRWPGAVARGALGLVAGMVTAVFTSRLRV
jgi:hypothetical protein